MFPGPFSHNVLAVDECKRSSSPPLAQCCQHRFPGAASARAVVVLPCDARTLPSAAAPSAVENDGHGRRLFSRSLRCMSAGSSGVLAAGLLVQLALMSGGLWRIRRCRIAATPLYPVPDAMRAAAAITQADALFCVSEEATGPVMLGWLAPVVLLPASFLTLDDEAQCGIACHELLHVKRGDWLVTLVEGFAGALLWFNPGVWLLLSEARLAREQLVDAESVRLTESLESDIDALLAIAREHVWSDLAAAPSFLHRSHLTQRMQLLLADAPTSAARLAGSLFPIAGILGCSIWFACATFPMLGQAGPEPAHSAIAADSRALPRLPAVAALSTPASLDTR